MSSDKQKICIVGSGNWGSAISRIIGFNAKRHSSIFNPIVNMWVFEETVNGRKLTEIINTEHENVKYLPGIKLPENVVAVPDLVEAAKDATVFVFVIPHQFVVKTCQQLVGKIRSDAIAVSLIKGVIATADRMQLISELITETLGLPTSVLMGANIANEVASEMFCESTVASRNEGQGKMLKELFQTDYFRISVVKDVPAAELCGALKNVVAVGAGFCDGLNYGNNTKAAVIRLGLAEIIKYIEFFYPGTDIKIYLESCGVADLITTCFGGRNRKVSEAFIQHPEKSMGDLEKELLGGQQLQGPGTAEEINVILKNRKMEDKFPLFTAVAKICRREVEPKQLITFLQHHPEHE